MSVILIVEDEQSVRTNLIELLENEGYDVLSAKNGQEGYAYAISCEPDLILSDIRMPVLNGIDMLKKLQANSATSMIPFIFLTAKTELHDMREGMSNGADDYIVKPFQIDDVLNAINSRLKKRDNYLSVIKEFRNTLMKRIPHELRTPLVGILGISGIMKENLESLSKEELSNMVEIINKSGKRLHRRIEKFLIYMELLPEFNYGKAAEFQDHFVADTDKITWLLLNKAKEYNREEDLTIKPEHAELKISKWHYETIINELLENSIKFSPKGSPITIKNMLAEDYYITQVMDSGEEIDIKNIDEIRIFNQFGKKGLTEEGMGLGLIIVKKIIDLSFGYLKISRENNISNIIEFGIPLSHNKTTAKTL